MRIRCPAWFVLETACPICPLLLYVEGPFLPARLAPPVVGFDVGIYFDRVGAGGEPPGGAFQVTGSPPVGEPLLLPVEVQVYVVPGQGGAVPVLDDGPDGGAGATNVSGRTNRGYENSAPRTTTAARVPPAARPPPSPPSTHTLINSSAVMSVPLENEEQDAGRISGRHRKCVPNPALFAG